MAAIIDSLGRITSYGYLPSGLAQSRQDGLGGVLTYSWDNFGQLIAVQSATRAVRTIMYDQQGWRQEEIDGPGNVWTYSYTMGGKPASVQDPLGNVVTRGDDLRGS